MNLDIVLVYYMSLFHGIKSGLDLLGLGLVATIYSRRLGTTSSVYPQNLVVIGSARESHVPP